MQASLIRSRALLLFATGSLFSLSACAPEGSSGDTGDTDLASNGLGDTLDFEALGARVGAGEVVELSVPSGRLQNLRVTPGVLSLGEDAARPGFQRFQVTSRDGLAALRESLDASVSAGNQANKQVAPPSSDTTAPFNQSVVAAGGAAWSTSTSVSLALFAEDDTAVTHMCLSSTSSCTSWSSYATTKTWSIGSTNGTRTVYAYFKDAAGNVSAAATDTIGVDTVKPVDGTATAVSTDAEIELNWSGFSDATSGINTYKVVYGTSSTPSSCSSGTVAYTGTDVTTTLSGLTNGTIYYFRVCAVDVAGNVSAGASVSGRPAPEFNPPTDGSVIINADAVYTKSRSVTLTLSATDDTAVSKMCISNGTTCSSWLSYAESKTWSLSGSGVRTVSVWFKDSYGNVSATPVTDTINLDATKPTNGTATATGSDGQVALTWTGFSDPGSGIASYKVVRAASSTAPSNCTSGTSVYEGTDLDYTDTGLTNGTTYSYRICAYDNAGNLSTGKTISGRPAPEYIGPTVGSVVINENATYSKSNSATLTLSAEDDSGISKMCISNTSKCTSWLAYATSKTWTLSGSGTNRTVYAYFQDSYGNISAAFTDTIIIDSKVPTNGTATASARSGSQVSFAISGFSDTASGMASYKIVYAKSATAPSSCSSGTVGYTGTSLSPTISGLLPNTLYSFRVCGLDAVGNISTGVTDSATTNLEATSPSATSIEINEGDEATTSLSVNLELYAEDASGVEEMCLSEDSVCSDSEWVPYDTDATWDFPDQGLNTLYVSFRDTYGNESELISDAILVDWTAPVDGTLTASQAGDGLAMFSWSGFSDAHSEIDSYRLVYSTDGSLPSSCDEGEIAYTGSELEAEVSGLYADMEYDFLVCAYDIAGNMSDGATASVTLTDVVAPVVDLVTINFDQAATNSTSVTVEAEGSDLGGIAEICISNTSECSVWTAWSASVPWTIDSVEGEQSVYVWLKDYAGNISQDAMSDSILFDQTAPVEGTLTLDWADGGTEVTLGGFVDDLAGMDGYIAVYTTGTVAPPDCSSGVEAYNGVETSFTVSGLTNGTTYAFRVCGQDLAGNISSGLTETVRPLPEMDAPEGTILLTGGAAYTADTTVDLDISATDASTIAQMCISSSALTCSNWESYDASTVAILGTSETEHSIYVWLADEWGTTMTVPMEDSVILDQTAPVDGSAYATPDDGSVILTWNDFTDSSSGVAGYYVVYAEGSAPADCSSGTLGYDGTDNDTTITALDNGTTYGFRVCAYDAVGNTSAGVTMTAKPAPEFDAPEGTVSVEAGATYAGSGTLNLTVSAVDESTVALMCFSDDPESCENWVAYDETASVVVPEVDGMATVYGWFEDEWGNVTDTPVSDTVTLDLTAPTGGAATASSSYDTEAQVSWSGFSDSVSGVASYKVVYAAGTTAPADCASGTVAYTGSSTSTTVTGLSSGSSYALRVCALDAVGNISAGVTATVTTPDTIAPSGTVSINAGAIGTKTTAVTLTFAPSETVTEVCVSSTTTCTTFSAYTATKAWTLATGAGVKTVYVKYKDAAGNISALISDTIIMDTTAPTNGTVTTNNLTAKQIALTWTGYSDAGSGIASYKVVYAMATSAPSSCSAGTVLYTGTSTSYTHTGLTTGKKYSYRVCAVDNATNTSTGTAKAGIAAK